MPVRSCSSEGSAWRWSTSPTRSSARSGRTDFAVGHDFSSHAVEQALTKGALNVGSQYLDLLAALALTAGMIVVSINAIRVGLLTRWMGVIGIFSGILIFLPIGGATLEIVPSFWMLGMGIALPWALAERGSARVGGGRGAPVADAGRASRRTRRAVRTNGKGKPALASGSDVAPAPAPLGLLAQARAQAPPVGVLSRRGR